jgi:hypothetical protein
MCTVARRAWFIAFLTMVVPTAAMAQSWSGVISPSRATDWSTAGVRGGIPNRTTICATLSPGASSSQINSAIDSCPAGQVVFLNAGTYNLSSGIQLDKSNVTLRGAGSSATILKISGITAVSCHIGAGRVINMCTDGGSNIGVDSAEHTATWNSGYADGTTVVALSNVTGLAVGSTLWLDQLDDSSDGWPSAGNVYMCDQGAPNCANNGTGESYARSGRGVLEGHIVTAISGTNVTITPGINMPVFRASQSPGAWWGNSGTILQNAGLENLTVDMTPCGGCAGLFMVNATNSWVKGVRFLKVDTNGSNIFHLFTVNVVNSTFTDNYFFGPNTTQLIAIYQMALHETSSSLIQNNIFHTASAPIVMNGPYYGNVIAYNYIDNAQGASIILHGIGGMNLYEGNNGANFSGDTIHSSHAFETIFRNHWDGRAHNPNATETQAAISLYSNNRFFNAVGNVMNTGHSTTYTTVNAHNTDAIFELGWQGTGSGTTVASDSNVNRTIMRWGNWDNVNNGTRFVASEIPSGIASFSNILPATQVLPSSMYLSAKPAFFAANTWPPIGPDVTGGNISGYGGHANKIPARICFENSALDSGYSGGVKRIDATACYASGGTPPNAPANLRIIP